MVTCRYFSCGKNEETAIHVEDINGDILFIYASDDLMWPSKDSVKYMVNRLKNKNWNHKVKTLLWINER
ncbi:acyl-CoA thioester hydrolase/BAAT C-terminal domain-containing protein [Clostridium sp. HCP1S3_B4]|uniref:acyl-CoA thioester hydrolase/BAAT C-terminal domain-containing protein n=1 Tax=unclassified Clostridium TaxID=2614128 RepID=UPI003F8896BC|nr:acyl-CoA thioester hydrolase/BAAT C-terminal domain-containing protein [Clostridiales bacterium]